MTSEEAEKIVGDYLRKNRKILVYDPEQRAEYNRALHALFSGDPQQACRIVSMHLKTVMNYEYACGDFIESYFDDLASAISVLKRQ